MTQSNIMRKALLLSLFTMASASAIDIYTGKTYLATRPQGINVAMEYTTWHEHAYKKHDSFIRSHIQLVPFYQHSEQENDLGKYFSINCKNSFIVGKAADVTAGKADIENGFLIHDTEAKNSPAADPSALRTLAGTVTFNPTQEMYGMRIDWFQDITHPFAKLYFKASAPFVHVANSMGLEVANSVKPTPAYLQYSLQDFFNGKVNVPRVDANGNPIPGQVDDSQGPLTNAKIGCRHTKSGVADIDLSVGYKYLEEETKHVFFSLDFTIPTGNKVRGIYLFEPMVGNGHHFGLGASLDSGIELWKNDKANVRLLAALRYKYLFENTENRTLGVKGVKLGHYFLVGQIGKSNQTFIPAANVLTMPLSVKPGSLIDSMVAFAFNSNNFTVDAGYNLFWKDQESVFLKRSSAKNFDAQNYAIVNPNLAASGPQSPDDDNHRLIDLNTTTIDVNAAKTPALLTHKIFAGVGYTSNIYKKYPCGVGIGGSYEFATSNADIENFAIWAKVMVSV